MPRIDDDGCELHMQLNAKMYDRDEIVSGGMMLGYLRDMVRLGIHRQVRIVAAGLAVLSSGFFFQQVDKGFMPEEDEGRFMITLKAPLGSSIDYTAAKLSRVEAILAEIPEITGSFATIGEGEAQQVNEAVMLINLAHWNDRSISQAEVMNVLRARIAHQRLGFDSFA